jgi:hypothetical protein
MELDETGEFWKHGHSCYFQKRQSGSMSYPPLDQNHTINSVFTDVDALVEHVAASI